MGSLTERFRNRGDSSQIAVSALLERKPSFRPENRSLCKTGRRTQSKLPFSALMTRIPNRHGVTVPPEGWDSGNVRSNHIAGNS